MTLYLFKHSNYYNRILKRYDDINDYIENSIQLGVYQNINFKPYDGVQTSQILNHQGDTPDYIVCVDDSLAINSRWYVIEDERLLNGQYRYTLLRDVIADYYSNILSAPCFVEKALLKADDPLIFNPEQMSFNQIKKGEYYLKDKSQSTWIVGYVDRASDVDSAQTQVNVLELTDPPNTIDLPADYVKYIKDSNNTVSNNVKSLGINWDSYIYNVSLPLQFVTYNSQGIFQKRYKNTIDRFNIVVNKKKPNILQQPDVVYDDIGDGGFPDLKFLGSICESGALGVNNTLAYANYYAFMATVMHDISINILEDNTLFSYVKQQFDEQLRSYSSTIQYKYDKDMNDEIVTYFTNNSDKIFKYRDSDNKTHYYKIKFNIETVSENLQEIFPNDYVENMVLLNIEKASTGSFKAYYSQSADVTAEYRSTTSDLSNEDKNIVRNNSINGNSSLGFSGLFLSLGKGNSLITIEATEIYDDIKVTLSSSAARPKNESGIYDVFAIPYTDGFKFKTTTYGEYTNNSDAAMRISQAIATELTTSKLYDLQILPYCPCPELIQIGDDGIQYLDTTPSDITTSKINFIYSGGTDDIPAIPLSMLIWCRESVYQSNINTPIELNQITDPLQKKIDSQTKMYRLCSPGYTSIYQFQPQMNDGISQFRLQIVFQPYNPFIRIAPIFNANSLYGIDSQYDSKGLILKGDFQIPRTDSPWEQYQVNNKNYSEIYDREVQNLELNQSIERKMQVANAISGAISGAVSGATTGAIVGGGVGAAVGAVVGGAASAIGGALDVKYGDMLREEALDYKNDMFGMQLDNIKALPNSLTKSSPLSDNNPIWPILEVYDCTDVEREALKDKIKYNGMTVGVIGTINSYLINKQYYRDYFNYMYFKGRLIRLDNAYADSHIINAISNELNRGIYL